jgi:O-antigen ligase
MAALIRTASVVDGDLSYAERMARDFSIFGTGAGLSFLTLPSCIEEFLFEEWQAYAHNDWLETRITFGIVGYALILLMLLILGLLLFTAQGMPAGLPLKGMIALAMAGCLVHAFFDFPFQIYSIIFLFVIFCSILSCSQSTRPNSETLGQPLHSE